MHNKKRRFVKSKPGRTTLFSCNNFQSLPHVASLARVTPHVPGLISLRLKSKLFLPLVGIFDSQQETRNTRNTRNPRKQWKKWPKGSTCHRPGRQSRRFSCVELYNETCTPGKETLPGPFRCSLRPRAFRGSLFDFDFPAQSLWLDVDIYSCGDADMLFVVCSILTSTIIPIR